VIARGARHGRFDHQHAGAGIGQHAEMGHVPIVADAVIARCTGTRRDDDAVRELETGKADGRKQSTRHGAPLIGLITYCGGKTESLARLNGLQAAHLRGQVPARGRTETRTGMELNTRQQRSVCPSAAQGVKPCDRMLERRVGERKAGC